MRPDARTYLWDGLDAARKIGRFSAGRSYDEYVSDELLRSAVERQFEIIGEALNQLSKWFPDIATQIPDLARIVAFRNVLIHAYASVDDAVVWQVCTDRLPKLTHQLERLLNELEA